ncbi:DNA polymerase II [Pokkaliibacter plantistimulans]|uniref:DNA polymerase n=1 Tax=Proteobacteria bacterium 228 TaxID=2083153 RepID=A0A2S5KH73_9PROT|nr:DNA polymerase II [Pokkaliibacter plantistimulans]PPC74110.1 DNA polymerase II [Pokkaliibacter plantistimulans]
MATNQVIPIDVEAPIQIRGYVLSRHGYDVAGSLCLGYWLWTAEGAIYWEVPEQEAICFIPAASAAEAQQALFDQEGWRLQPLPLTDFSQQPVLGLYCRSLSGFYRCREKLQAAHIPLMEEDIRPQERFLMERGIRAGLEVRGSWRRNTDGSLHLISQQARKAEVQPELRLLSLDIETTMDARRIYSIALQMADRSVVLMQREEAPRPESVDPALQVEWFDSCRAMLEAMQDYFQRWDPDAIIGWSVVGFDLKVLARACEQERLPLRWGRGMQEVQLRESRTTNHHFVDWPGRVVLDGIDTLRGATWQFESFALNEVARELLGREKLIEDPDQRGEEITRLFRHDPWALAAYNLEDCRLVSDIFAHAKLMPYLIARADLTGLSLDRVGGSAAAFDYLYLPRLHRKGYVAPVYASGDATVDSPGGFVMNSRPGLYDHVLVLDFKSLYPSIIRTFLIDPYALVEGLSGAHPDSEQVDGFNQASFWRQGPILPALVAECWQARDQAKRDGNIPLATAIKIIMNAFYGVLGSPLCRFFDRRLSGSITLRGHQILQDSQAWFQRQGYEVIYGDTDSLFVHLHGHHSEEQACSRGRELAAAINDWWRDRLLTEFNLASHLEIQFEVHYRRFLMPTIRGSQEGSKKRYAGLVSKGSDHKLVFKGLESVRSDWTPFARRIQRELYERVFLNQPYRNWLRQQVDDLLGGRCDAELVYRKRLRRPLDAYQKNVPPHVQAARKMREHRRQQGLPERYERGSSVEYVLTLHGPEALGLTTAPLDYELYIERQLKPVVDSILIFVNDGYDKSLAPQADLFYDLDKTKD